MFQNIFLKTFQNASRLLLQILLSVVLFLGILWTCSPLFHGLPWWTQICEDWWVFSDSIFVSQVFAQSTTPWETNKSGKKATDKEIWTANSLQNIVRVIYLLMRPLLAIAWAALDNSLVYGEAFFLNISLWKMRQIMRNFANFALWWVFLFSLLYSVSTWWAWDSWTWGLKNILPKMVIAWILIQASRFGMKALIDLSTVALYSVWWLPLNILQDDLKDQQDSDSNNLKYLHFLEPQIQFSFDNNDAEIWTDGSLSVFYTCRNATRAEHAKKYFLPCRIEWNAFIPYGAIWKNNTWKDWENSEAAKRANFWRDDDDTNGDKTVTTQEVREKISREFCVHWNKLLYMLDDDPLVPPLLPPDPAEPSPDDDERQARNDDNIPVNAIFGQKMDDCKIDDLILKAHLADTYWPEYPMKWWAMAAFECPKLNSIIDKAAWMTWPMYALYASVLNMSELALTPNHKWVIEISLEFLVKALTALALIIPLLTLAIVLVMRAVILWWFIIFSPLLVLWRLFFSEKVSGASEHATLQSLLSLVFMPVVAVFAIWMSLVILWLFQKPQINPQNDVATLLWLVQQNDGDVCVWVREWPEDNKKLVWKKREKWCPKGGCWQTNKECYSMLWIYVLCFTESQRQFGNGILNVMTRLIINMFWIWLMWTVVFAALKTSTITRSVVSWIQDVSTQVLKALPVVPTPMGLTSVWALWTAASQAANIPQQMMSSQAGEIDKYIKDAQAQNSEWAQNVQETLNKITWTWDEAAGQLKPVEAYERTSLLNNDTFYQKLSASASPDWNKSYKNMESVLSSREWYNALRKYWGWSIWEAQRKLVKKTWIVWDQEKASIWNLLFNKLPSLDWVNASTKNNPNTYGLFYDTKNKEVIKMERTQTWVPWTITHSPLVENVSNLEKTTANLNSVLSTLSSASWDDPQQRADLVNGLWLEWNALFDQVNKKIKEFKGPWVVNATDYDNLPEQPKFDIMIDGSPYSLTFTNKTFKTILSLKKPWGTQASWSTTSP